MRELHEKADKNHSDIRHAVLCYDKEIDLLKGIVKRMEKGENISLSAFEITLRTENKTETIVDVMGFSNYGRAQFNGYSREFEKNI